MQLYVHLDIGSQGDVPHRARYREEGRKSIRVQVTYHKITEAAEVFNTYDIVIMSVLFDFIMSFCH